MAAWRLFGHDVTTEQLPAELRSILAQMQRERVAFEALTNAARDSSQNLTQLTQPIADAQKTVGEMQARVKALERLVPVLATLDEQTEAVSKVQRRTETQLTHTAEDAKRLRAEIEELRGAFDQALTVKSDLAGFLELKAGFEALRLDADGLGTQLREITQGFEQARERQEKLRAVTEAAAASLQTFAERAQQVQSGVAAAESRTAALEQTVAQLAQVATDAAQTKHQLGTLQALADGALQRSEQIAAHHADVKREDQVLRDRLSDLRDEVQRAVKRFELEHQGLDAASQRIVDLRSGLSDMEARFRTLDESSRSIADVRARADGVAAQLDTLGENVGQLEAQTERVRAVQANAERLEQAVQEMTERVTRLEKSQPAVDAALADVAGLKGSHEVVKDAIEQVRVAEAELSRVREAQVGTKAWLATAIESVDALRGELAAVEELKPTVEVVRGEADRLSQAMAQIAARRELVEGLNTQLTALTAFGAQLEERTQGLLARMERADERFQALALPAAEAERIAKLVPTTVTTVERAERRMADVDARVAAVESRAHAIEGLAERTRALGQELEQRQAALDKATEHLEQASRLRGEAAAAAQQLDERAGQLTNTLATAQGRTTELQAILDELDARAGGLRFAQKRMAQFEERIAKFESAEGQLTRALEQVTRRQATLDAMQAEMHRLFEVAERTVDHVRAIAGAKQEVSETRGMLENVLSMVSHAHDVANRLDQRKRQVEQAEERLGRVEALLGDLHASLETLRAQKALVDQVIERAGSLEFHTKQAEALIATLRQERDLTDRARAAGTQPPQEGNAKSA
jgi:chromosome segregation ATPase